MSANSQTTLLLAVAMAAGLISSVAVSDFIAKGREVTSDAADLTRTSLGQAHEEDLSLWTNEPGETKSSGNEAVEFWPPIDGQRYPDLVLEDSNGKTVRLSDHAGKIIFIELAAVPCKGCQAFAGGNKYGGFAGVGVQSGLDSIHEYTQRIASINLRSNSEVLFVQLLLYGKSMGRPTQEETRGWSEHFRMKGSHSQMVLRGDSSMVSQISYSMIPGFHLIDRDFVLRSNSCGHNPNENLYTELLPKLRKLSREPKRATPGERHGNPFLAQ